MSSFEAHIREVVREEVERQLAKLDNGSSDTGSPWLSVAAAAAYLCVSERTLERRIKGGRVRSTTIGRRRLLHRDDLDALARAATGEETVATAPPRHRGE